MIENRERENGPFMTELPSGVRRVTVDGVRCPQCGGSASLTIDAPPGGLYNDFVITCLNRPCQLAVYTMRLTVDDVCDPETEEA